jgi:hypothetical protein
MIGAYRRIVVIALLASALLASGPLARIGEGASATGNAYFTFDDGPVRAVSFDAVRQKNKVAGQIDIQDRTPIPSQDVDGTGDPDLAESPEGVDLNAQVECLVIDGPVAVIGGQVTQADVARYVGKYVLLFVEDRGRGPARLNWGFYESGTGTSCESFPQAAYSLVEVTAGSVKVRP